MQGYAYLASFETVAYLLLIGGILQYGSWCSWCRRCSQGEVVVGVDGDPLQDEPSFVYFIKEEQGLRVLCCYACF
jgi:hypothetical protein